MHDLQSITRRLDAISRDIEATARKQETISKLLALLAVHIPDVAPNEDVKVPNTDHGLLPPCFCQITFSDLKAGG